MELTVYASQHCTICREALQFLDKLGLHYLLISIDDQAPQKHELDKVLRFYDNQWGVLLNPEVPLYAELGIADKVAAQRSDELFPLVQSHSALLRHPILLSSSIGVGIVGFEPKEWRSKLDIYASH